MVEPYRELLSCHVWISWVQLTIIVYAALDMMRNGSHQIGFRFVPRGVCQADTIAIFQDVL